MTSCGNVGWVTDRRGYRYSSTDPDTGEPWPAMPQSLLALAGDAAREAGFDAFVPDSCLINRYAPGAKMSLHQDKDERDFDAPIVSVSLGLPATFLFGGAKRSDPTVKLPLVHGDVVVWGGPARLFFHGVSAVKPGHHPLVGECRINLTFRKAV
jgi:alkylated DNA repair protein (DNA oxidative demethylase)